MGHMKRKSNYREMKYGRRQEIVTMDRWNTWWEIGTAKGWNR
jgi:hypothetical protein